MSKVRGKPFQPGNKSGHGRPKGSRNKTGNQAQLLLNQHSEALMRACILAAMKGDMRAMQLCMERDFPARRDPGVRMRLGPTNTAAELAVAGQRVVRGIGSGKITPAEAEKVTNVLEHRRKIIETVEHSTRLEKLEVAQAALERKSNDRQGKK